MATHGAAWFLALVSMSTTLAGCIGADDTSDDDLAANAVLDWVFQDFIIDEHDHGIPADHVLETPTMHAMAFNVLNPDGEPFSYIGEMDTRADRTVVAVVGRGSTPGFVLLNTSDPAKPQYMNRVELPYAYMVDVKLSSDATWVFAATQQITTGRIGAPTPDSIADGSYLVKNGIATYHVTPEGELHFVHFQPVEPMGCHMLSVYATDANADNPFVWCIGASVTTFQWVPGATSMVPIGTYWPFDTAGLPVATAKGVPMGLMPHDMTFQLDPLVGTEVLTISHWDNGVRVLDVTDKAVPREILAWNGEGAEHYQGFAHSAMLTVIDGKRYLVATPETTRSILPAIWVLDATDWSAPKLVAEWVNPGNHLSQGLLMTTHQFQLVGERMYMTYNHNGVWVLDLRSMIETGGNSDDNREILGVALPQAPIAPYENAGMGVPAVWDLNVVDGYILATDRYTGLHVLHYALDANTPEVTSFA